MRGVVSLVDPSAFTSCARVLTVKVCAESPSNHRSYPNRTTPSRPWRRASVVEVDGGTGGVRVEHEEAGTDASGATRR